MGRLTKEQIEYLRGNLHEEYYPDDHLMAKIDALCDLALQALSLESVREEALDVLEEGYAVLADITNQWEGRHTLAGQRLLCKMRDAIANATGRSAEDVQDNPIHSPARVAETFDLKKHLSKPEQIIEIDENGKVSLTSPESPAKEQPSADEVPHFWMGHRNKEPSTEEIMRLSDKLVQAITEDYWEDAIVRWPQRFLHTKECNVHEPTLSLCSCGLETRLKDEILRLQYRLYKESTKEQPGEKYA